MRYILLVLQLLLLYVTLQSQHLSTKGINEQAIVLIQASNKNTDTTSLGTGLLLYNYTNKDTVILLTAHHVIKNYDELNVYFGTDKETLEQAFVKNIVIQDSLNTYYKVFTNSKNDTMDIALVFIDNSLILPKFKSTRTILTKSFCVYSDSLFLGDDIVAFGYPPFDKYDFVLKGYPLVTSGVISHKLKNIYLIDKKVHKGMSGGIVFKRYPYVKEYGFKAAGIITASLSRDSDYSWIVPLDYIDSIFNSNFGFNWGDLPKIKE